MRAHVAFKSFISGVISIISVLLVFTFSGCSYKHLKGGEPITPPPPGALPPTNGAGTDRVSQYSYAQVNDKVIGPRCASCHRHSQEFSTYASAFSKRDVIRQHVFQDQDMPQDGPLTPEESTMLLSWLDAGALEQASP